MSIETKKAVFALRLQGRTNDEIAERLHLHPVTVCRIFSAMKKLEAAGVVPKEDSKPASDHDLLRDWKERLRRKSIRALDRGLEDETDNYKSGNLGMQTLKGLGELQGDSAIVRINALIASTPPEFRQRYMGPTDESVPRILPSEQHELWALEVFKRSNCNAAEFNERRRDAREGRIFLVSNDEEENEFFRAEEARGSLER